MRVVPALIIAFSILLLVAMGFLIPRLLRGPQASGGMAGGSAIDSGARIQIEMLNQRIEQLEARMEAVTETVREMGGKISTQLAARPMPQQMPQMQQQDAPQDAAPTGPKAIIDAYAQVVLIANRRNVNDGLKIAGPSYLAKTFGLPRENLTDSCQSMTNPRLAGKLKVANVGPIKVQMLQPAIDSLRRVFENVKATDPDLYARINTAGSLCVRLIRGSRNRASTHAYGLAVDLNIDGHLDTLGDGKTQLGLTILADFFKAEGWAWGASWRREDSMHFEVSRQKLDEWIAEGAL